MRFSIDPFQANRLRSAVAVLVLAPAAVAVGLWAYRPVVIPAATPSGTVADGPPDAGAAGPVLTPIDPAVFAIDLWSGIGPEAAPAPETTPAKPTLPPRVPLRLLGITERGEELLANLYDEKGDAILIVGAGARIHGYTVDEIGMDGVRLTRGKQSLRLLLEEDGS